MKKTYKLLLCILLAFPLFTTAYTVSFAEDADGTYIGESAEITDTGVGITDNGDDIDDVENEYVSDGDGTVARENVFEILFLEVLFSCHVVSPFCALFMVTSMPTRNIRKDKDFPCRHYLITNTSLSFPLRECLW